MCETCEKLRNLRKPTLEDVKTILQAHRMANDCCVSVCVLDVLADMGAPTSIL